MTLFLFLGDVLQYSSPRGLPAYPAKNYTGIDVSMQARFALSLSPDRIQLLHDAATGWQDLGQVDPASATLQQELADLKATAEAAMGGETACTLILPNAHIRYLHIEDAPAEAAERRKAAEDALEAATPYRANALAIDIVAEGSGMWIAGVARDTLSEAESFATAHGFEPVDFVAWPDPELFPHAAHFGTCAMASNRLASASKHATEDEPAVSAKPVSGPKDVQRPDAEHGAGDAGPDLTSQRRVPTFQTVRRRDVIEAKPQLARATPPARFNNKPAHQTLDLRNRRADLSSSLRPQTEPAQAPRRRKATVAVASVAVMGLAALAAASAGPRIASFFAILSSPPPTAQFTAPQQPYSPTTVPDTLENSASLDLAALNLQMSDEDAAVLDALSTPVLNQPVPRGDRTEDELRAAYAVTGIWPIAPEVPSPPSVIELNDLYQTSIDPVGVGFDAVALPSSDLPGNDVAMIAPAAPAPAGTQFVLDDKGLVVPTLEGTLNPDGVMVFAGAPPLSPPDKLERAPVPIEPIAVSVVRPELEAFRPKARPTDLIETNERVAFSGLTRSELGQMRPRMRPQSAQDAAQQAEVATAVSAASASLVPLDDDVAAPLIDNTPVDAASLVTGLAASLRPGTRPNNFAAIVARTEEKTPVPTQAAARVTPRNVAPSIPSSASVTREATIQNAINLRRVNLIGVYGKPSSRRALVRLSNGRYRKVEVGDRIDGGRVSAIGDAELRYQKSGRDVVLTMPRG